ncbi:MAG: hypothetical protein GDA67_15430 [Nitrospira sp. CR1.3]|nr:hypothetical protein [Nitrospira sp. CR1.3]
MRTRLFGLVTVLFLSNPVSGDITVPGADGSDGAFNPATNVTINLALAPTGTWNGPNSSPGNGVYDPDKWAVVFRYSSVNIASGRTVTFSSHPSGAPVIWLLNGPVTIAGTLDVSSRKIAGIGNNTFLGFELPGPGGFRGAGSNTTGGLGPGGTDSGSHASYGTGTRAYGNSRVVPLIGGSGAGSSGNYGEAGGGAILIAATSLVTLNGAVRANASVDSFGPPLNPGGSGGAIRMICDSLSGTGQLRATPTGSATGGSNKGRIRIEINQGGIASSDPAYSQGVVGSIAQLWPEDVVADSPSTRVVSLGSNNVPTDPQASFEFPYADVNTATSGAQTLVIECKNIPTGLDPIGVQAWNVKARIVPRSGTVQNITASYVSGDYSLSTWEAQVTLPTGFSAIQVRASMPPQ